MTKYAIFTCTHTRDCYDDFRESHGAFVPIERKSRERNGVRVEISSLLLPGMVFIPMLHAPDFRRRATRYSARQQYTRVNQTPLLVPFAALQTMQDLLDREYADSQGYFFTVGMNVEVFGIPSFPEGVLGTVVKIKSNGRARVNLRHQYIEIHKRFLRPV